VDARVIWATQGFVFSESFHQAFRYRDSRAHPRISHHTKGLRSISKSRFEFALNHTIDVAAAWSEQAKMSVLSVGVIGFHISIFRLCGAMFIRFRRPLFDDGFKRNLILRFGLDRGLVVKYRELVNDRDL